MLMCLTFLSQMLQLIVRPSFVVVLCLWSAVSLRFWFKSCRIHVPVTHVAGSVLPFSGETNSGDLEWKLVQGTVTWRGDSLYPSLVLLCRKVPQTCQRSTRLEWLRGPWIRSSQSWARWCGCWNRAHVAVWFFSCCVLLRADPGAAAWPFIKRVTGLWFAA